MTTSNPIWPPSTGLTTKVAPASSAVLTCSGSATISAPASLVFSIIRDTVRYPEWNSFVPRVSIASQPSGVDGDGPDGKLLYEGTKFTFHVVMDRSHPGRVNDTHLIVSDISTPDHPSTYLSAEELEDGTYTNDLTKVYRISWRHGDGIMSYGMQLERFHEVIVREEKECEIRTWEVQKGPLAYVVKAMFQKTLDEKFGDWCVDLKGFCEKLVKE